MNKEWIRIRNKLSSEYAEGVKEFLELAKNHVNRVGLLRCPCKKCMNNSWLSTNDIERHLLIHGMLESYVHWVYHGEPTDLSGLDREMRRDFVFPRMADERRDAHVEPYNDDANIVEMLNDINRERIETEDVVENNNTFEIENPIPIDEDNVQARSMDNIMMEASERLFPGCTTFSSLNFLVKLMYYKVSNKWSDKSFDLVLKLLNRAFVDVKVSIPGSFYEAKWKLRDLGLTYDSIHACKYDCILYRNEYKDLDQCPICDESRYKVITEKGTKIPHKVLRHFPLIPRLRRMFSSKQNAADMRWHKEKRIDESGVLRHPADGEGWKHLDRQFPQFALESRNVRLGLSSDGFNPFGI